MTAADHSFRDGPKTTTNGEDSTGTDADPTMYQKTHFSTLLDLSLNFQRNVYVRG